MPSRMTGLRQARINTAGAYVSIDGLYPFALGIKLHNGNIPIIRLGGHREEDETGWQCAAREVYEETGLVIRPVVPESTYLLDWEDLDGELQEIRWCHEIEPEPAPLLIITYCRNSTTSLSMMYLAEAGGMPVPSSEVMGLLLLNKDEIHRLCLEPQTLEEYLGMGGRAILKAEFDMHLVLEPFAQLRILSRLLSVRAVNHAIQV